MKKRVHETPIDPLTLFSDGAHLIGCFFTGSVVPSSLAQASPGSDSVLDAACAQLDEYFAGRRSRFELPLAPIGTPFQRSVWRALEQIPFGTTSSYGVVAQSIGKPKAMRAVGAANGQNPICIIIPCHRVIGANGSLTGFGGGLARKRFLLALEQPQAVLFESPDT